MEKPSNIDNPWVGISSYEDPVIMVREGRKPKLFCSRDVESNELIRLITGNILVTLYGKSGTGKTSLLNAGVFPLLREKRYLPINIRLSTDAQNDTFQHCIINMIEQSVNKMGGQQKTLEVIPMPNDKQCPEYLWCYFARTRFTFTNPSCQSPQLLFPVVAFDQFEEILRDRLYETEALLRQIAYLMDESHALSNRIVDGIPYQYDFNFRFVISIREDTLYRLEDSIDNNYLSELKRCRYRLRSLSKQGAMEAILLPGERCIDSDSKNVVAERIIQLAKRTEDGEIDTLLLSMVCAGSFDKKAEDKISLSDLNVWKDNPMEVYYHDAIQGLPNNEILYIQENLIYADGTRKRVTIDDVTSSLGPSSYKKLTTGENRLLRINDQNQVELIHDKLAAAIFTDRENRKEREVKIRKISKLFGWIFTCANIIASIVFLVMLIISLKQEKVSKENLSKFIAERAISMKNQNDYRLANLFALEALQNTKDFNNPIDKPYTAEAENALRQILAQDYFSLTADKNNQFGAFCYSPEGNYIATSDFNGKIEIRDINNNYKVTNTIQTTDNERSSILSLSFFQDNEHILFSGFGYIKMWNVAEDSIQTIIDGKGQWIDHVIVNPNKKEIAASFYDRSIRVFNEKGYEIRVIKGHEGNIYSLAYSFDGNHILSASQDCTVRLWDTFGKEKILCGHTGTVTSATFSPDGQTFASASYDKSIIIWDYNGTILKKINCEQPLSSITYHPSGKYIVVGTLYSNDIYDLDTGERISSIKSDTKWPYRIVFNPSGTHISYFSAERKEIKIQPIDFSGESIQNVKILDYGKSTIASFSPNDSLLIIPDSEGHIKLKDISTGETIRILQGHSDIVNCVSFCPDGKRIVSASNDSTIMIWDVNSGIAIMTLTGHTSAVNCASFSPDGKNIVSASDDKTLIVWDAASGNAINILTGHSSAVNCASFSPDSKYIISASDDNRIIVWDKKTGKKTRVLKGHKRPINHIEYSPNGKYIVSASDDSCIMIWKATTGNIIDTIQELGPVKSFSISPDGRYLASASYNKSILVRDFKTRNEIFTINGGSRNEVYSFVCFSPSGNQIASISEHTSIHSFPSLKELINQVHERFKDRHLTPEERRIYNLE